MPNIVKLLAQAFNQTSMELKLDNFEGAFQTFTSSFNQTSMELKLRAAKRLYMTVNAFNQTSMELKLIFGSLAHTMLLLLIRPVWN